MAAIPLVNPDLFQGPLCGEETGLRSTHPPAARWTPERGRGDGWLGAGERYGMMSFGEARDAAVR